jgi:hypothetical protein
MGHSMVSIGCASAFVATELAGQEVHVLEPLWA